MLFLSPITLALALAFAMRSADSRSNKIPLATDQQSSTTLSDFTEKEDAQHLMRHLFVNSDLSLSMSYGTTESPVKTPYPTVIPDEIIKGDKTPTSAPNRSNPKTPTKGTTMGSLKPVTKPTNKDQTPSTTVTKKPTKTTPTSPTKAPADKPKKSPVEGDNTNKSPTTTKKTSVSPALIATIAVLVAAVLVVTGLAVYRRRLTASS